MRAIAVYRQLRSWSFPEPAHLRSRCLSGSSSRHRRPACRRAAARMPTRRRAGRRSISPCSRSGHRRNARRSGADYVPLGDACADRTRCDRRRRIPAERTMQRGGLSPAPRFSCAEVRICRRRVLARRWLRTHQCLRANPRRAGPAARHLAAGAARVTPPPPVAPRPVPSVVAPLPPAELRRAARRDPRALLWRPWNRHAALPMPPKNETHEAARSTAAACFRCIMV